MSARAFASAAVIGPAARDGFLARAGGARQPALHGRSRRLGLPIFLGLLGATARTRCPREISRPLLEALLAGAAAHESAKYFRRVAGARSRRGVAVERHDLAYGFGPLSAE